MTAKETREILSMNKAERTAALAAMAARLAAKAERTAAAPVKPAHVPAAHWATLDHAGRVAFVNLYNENVAYRATISGRAL